MTMIYVLFSGLLDWNLQNKTVKLNNVLSLNINWFGGSNVPCVFYEPSEIQQFDILCLPLGQQFITTKIFIFKAQWLVHI